MEPLLHSDSFNGDIRQLRLMLSLGERASLLCAGGHRAVELPEPVRSLLLQIVEEMERGNSVSVVAVGQELTTQQAAEIVGVSRPFFVGLLEAGKVPFHFAGSHRRVYLRDLLAFKRERDRERRESLERMGDAMEEAGVYDKVLLPEE
jgi:excisionase family DNA binding protein